MPNIDWKNLGFGFSDVNCHIRYVWKDGDYRFEEGRVGIAETYELRVLDFVEQLKARGVE